MIASTVRTAGPTRLPKDVDALTRREERTLADLHEAIPRELFVPSTTRSFAALARVLATVALLAYLTSLVELRSGLDWLLLVGLTIAQGTALVGLFVIGHDAGHNAFAKSRWLNQVIGHLTMAPLLTTLKSWQLFHDYHHRYPQKHGAQLDFCRYLVTREELADASLMTRLGYRVPGGFIFWILGGIYRRATLARSIPELVPNAAEARRLRISSACTLGIVVALWTALALIGGPLAIIEYHLAPVVVTTLIGSLLVTVQHTNMDALFYTPEAWTPLRGQIVSTFDVRFPRLFEWLWCDINLHVAHHVSPRIPWYHLRRAGRALSQKFPDYYQERRFGRSELSFLWRTPFLRPIDGLGSLEFERSER